MTYRIQISESADGIRVAFRGTLDPQALCHLRELAADVGRKGAAAVELVLEEGTEVDSDCIEGLRRLEGVAVRAQARFLALWLAQGPKP